MIVYVETNFLLEIILGQEELEHANQIIQLAQENRIDLRLPSFSFMEPLWTIKSRGNERKSIHTALTKELSQLSRYVTPIQISRDIYERSLRYQSEYALSPQDSIVYSSIMFDLEMQQKDTPKVFVSKNSRDFDRDDLKEELRTHNCKYLAKFANALGYIRSRL